MIRSGSVPAVVFLVLATVGLSASGAHAQILLPPNAQTASTNAVPAIRLPRVMVSFGVGTSSVDDANWTGAPLQTASVQFLPGRYFVLEADASHLATGRRSTWSGGGNLLYRSEPRRFAAFVGGGAFVGHSYNVGAFGPEGCVAPPGVQDYCPPAFAYNRPHVGLYLRALTGADVGIAGPLRVYGALQLTTMSPSNFRVSMGVRVVALTQRADRNAAGRARPIREAGTAPQAPSTTSPAGQAPMTAVAAAGKDVRISLVNGARPQGKFVALTARELAVRQGNRDVRYPLDQVLLVETVHHTARKAAIGGAFAGFFGGWLGTCGIEREGQSCLPEAGALFGGIGAGAGAIVGALVDRSRARNHVVYAAPRPSPSVHVIPVLTPMKAGVAVALRW